MGKSIVHVEFPAKDTDRAEGFWEGFAGWTIESAGMEGMDYRMFQDEGWGGAVYPQQEGEQGPVGHPALERQLDTKDAAAVHKPALV